ncbi:hypothetical protein HELRODRAFT_186263 [Helobdella robusta]|uniref:Ergosterol biosynthetic protein 28 n=1 Tax=Helobdella robusta TaxID=6412 RepID=T1FNW0_HELRO|nr:hypothetical protein HELRODRAFT_186263 [Helobdella robusta]ESO11107.1 hypothetical protein HELRODRAFT_186263 [Helobdella robusta]
MFSKENLLRSLQGWIFMVGLVALGNTVSCFIDHSFLGSRLYTASPANVNNLVARLFGIWTLLAAVLRICCAICIHNQAVYHLTLLSFLLALGHFLSEIFIFNTAEVTVGILTPIIISALSTLFMIVGTCFLLKDDVKPEFDNMPKSVEDIIFNKKVKRAKKD